MDNDFFIAEIKKRLTEKRFHHSMCVSDMAVSLAKVHGCDAEKARTAGILHDIMKTADTAEQLQLIERFGIILDNFEKNSKPLWHAKLGAAFLENEYNIKDKDILGAVRYHTTGRAGMTDFEKIIFVADAVSLDRDYSDIEEIRKLAHENLDESVLAVLSFNFCDLSERRKIIHPDALALYNELIMEKEGK